MTAFVIIVQLAILPVMGLSIFAALLGLGLWIGQWSFMPE